MLCIFNTNKDVYFNLAMEEYLLKNFVEDIMMVWSSWPSVVVGKHQNTFAEINHSYIRENNIPVARRLTGGGTVFHDEGNLNFTFIKNGDDGKLVDFKGFIKPIVEFLGSMDISAVIGNKNEILVNNLKISGNAEHVHKSRVLHHGTLLFSSNLKKLGVALQVDPGRYIDKSVQSNRAKVTNISDHLSKELSFGAFAEYLYTFLLENSKDGIVFKLKEKDTEAITKLRDEKYISWEWIYGYSPPFSLTRKIKIGGVEYSFKLKVSKGIINEAEVMNCVSNNTFEHIVKSLIGLRFEYQEVENRLKGFQLDTDIKNIFPEILF
jgi:lipoate-protein ligase A